MKLKLDDFKTTSIEVIADKMKRLKADGRSTVVLIGAGVSVSGDIPSAKEIIEDIKGKFKSEVKLSDGKGYAQYMDCIDHADRKNLIDNYIKNSKVNLAHLYLGSLVEAGYVDAIVTTNFDPLAIKALNLYNRFPAIYDLAITKQYSPSSIVHPCIVYLHGQSHGFWQLNSEAELELPVKTIKKVLQDISKDRSWLVIGYSGDDPVLDQLGAIKRFDNTLNWVCYKDELPNERVHKTLFSKKTNGAKLLFDDYDADKFFLELHNKLGVAYQQILSKPFSLLENVINNISEKATFDDKTRELTTTSKRWVEEAKQFYEEGKNVGSLKQMRKKVRDDELLNLARRLWINEDYENIDKYYTEIVTSGNKQANYFLAEAYSQWGYKLKLKADESLDNNEIIELLKHSLVKHEIASSLNPHGADIWNAWSISLIDYHHTVSKKHVNKILDDALKKAEKAESIKKGSGSYNIACVHSLQGDLDLALEWFQSAMRKRSGESRFHILNDRDLDNIKHLPKFKELLDKYRPEGKA